MKNIIVTIEGGVVQSVDNVPLGITIEVRDWDAFETYPPAIGERVYTDPETKDYAQVSLYEGTEPVTIFILTGDTDEGNWQRVFRTLESQEAAMRELMENHEFNHAGYDNIDHAWEAFIEDQSSGLDYYTKDTIVLE